MQSKISECYHAKRKDRHNFPTQTTLLTHLQDKYKLLPASYTPHASFCLKLFSFLLSAHYEKVILFSHFAGSWNSPNEGSRAEMHLSHPSAKIPATYGAVMTPSFRWRGKQAAGLGSFVTLHLLDEYGKTDEGRHFNYFTLTFYYNIK